MSFSLLGSMITALVFMSMPTVASADTLCWFTRDEEGSGLPKGAFVVFSEDLAPKSQNESLFLNLKTLANGGELKVSHFSSDSPGNEIGDSLMTKCNRPSIEPGDFYCANRGGYTLFLSAIQAQARIIRRSEPAGYVLQRSCYNVPSQDLDKGVLAQVVRNQYESVYPPLWECALKRTMSSVEIADSNECVTNPNGISFKGLYCYLKPRKTLDPGFGRILDQSAIDYCAKMSRTETVQANARTEPRISDQNQKKLTPPPPL